MIGVFRGLVVGQMAGRRTPAARPRTPAAAGRDGRPRSRGRRARRAAGSACASGCGTTRAGWSTTPACGRCRTAGPSRRGARRGGSRRRRSRPAEKTRLWWQSRQPAWAWAATRAGTRCPGGRTAAACASGDQPSAVWQVAQSPARSPCGLWAAGGAWAVHHEERRHEAARSQSRAEDDAVDGSCPPSARPLAAAMAVGAGLPNSTVAHDFSPIRRPLRDDSRCRGPPGARPPAGRTSRGRGRSAPRVQCVGSWQRAQSVRPSFGRSGPSCGSWWQPAHVVGRPAKRKRAAFAGMAAPARDARRGVATRGKRRARVVERDRRPGRRRVAVSHVPRRAVCPRCGSRVALRRRRWRRSGAARWRARAGRAARTRARAGAPRDLVVAVVAGHGQVRARQRECASSRGRRAEKRAGSKPSTSWQDSQRPPSARRASWPAWRSSWQSVQRACAIGRGRPGRWQESHSTFACSPRSGKPVRSWSNCPGCDLRPAGGGVAASRTRPSRPACGSLWQLAQVWNAMPWNFMPPPGPRAWQPRAGHRLVPAGEREARAPVVEAARRRSASSPRCCGTTRTARPGVPRADRDGSARRSRCGVPLNRGGFARAAAGGSARRRPARARPVSGNAVLSWSKRAGGFQWSGVVAVRAAPRRELARCADRRGTTCRRCRGRGTCARGWPRRGRGARRSRILPRGVARLAAERARGVPRAGSRSARGRTRPCPPCPRRRARRRGPGARRGSARSRAVVLPRVQALAGGDALAERGVAGEAALARDALPASWHARQLRAPFERLVEAAGRSRARAAPRAAAAQGRTSSAGEERALHGQPNP